MTKADHSKIGGKRFPSAKAERTDDSPAGKRGSVDRAVFLDRDGVLVEEVHLLAKPADIRIREEVPRALQFLKQAGFRLIVISNQAVVARGLISESQVAAINRRMEALLVEAGAPRLDGSYFCPHHPQATLAAYRVVCECRKPRPGMLRQAAREHHLELSACFMVGDRITDVIAGHQAGCKTVLLMTGAHESDPIETAEPIDKSIKPDFTCSTLQQAVDWVLKA